MPGSGKTYWMKQLAPLFQYSAVDMDDYIQNSERQTIEQLFERGALYFREKERHALNRIIQRYPRQIVVATGGGTPCYQDNMALMKAAGCVVYLRAPLKTIQANLARSEIRRPLLDNGDGRAIATKIMQLFLERQAFYEQADIKIDIINASLLTFAQAISPHLPLV